LSDPYRAWPVGSPGGYRPRRWLPVLLFALTFFSTTTLGAGWYLSTRTDVTYVPADVAAGMVWLGPATVAQVWGDRALLAVGLAFSVPTMLILLCHELGHYLMCRRYGVAATWPHFLPVPIGLGTFGAFIRIKAPIRTKRQLFDIGVAGPVAGFAALLPFLVYGLWRSTPRTLEVAAPLTTDWILYLPGRSLLFRLVESAFHGPATADRVLDLHPFALAAWVGLLVTSLNLLPLGQLDGGHLLYAVAGRRQRQLAPVLWAALVVAGFYWPGWWLWSLLLLVMRLGHPPVRDEAVPLDRRRRLLALGALALLVLSFMPVPLEMVWVDN
jgi:membrane-associated protease RseP (regulator of RpoE activity)